jgi:hypothetical protein
MIHLTDVFCVLLRYYGASNISDYIKRLIQLSVIQLSGRYCIFNVNFKMITRQRFSDVV